MKYAIRTAPVLALLFSMVSSIASAERPTVGEKFQCAGNTQEVGACLQGAMDADERNLNGVYSVITRMLEAGPVDPTFKSAAFSALQKDLLISQSAWKKYREAQAALTASMSAPGSGVSAQYGYSWIALTRERILFLQEIGGQIAEESALCSRSAGQCQMRSITQPE